MKQTRREFVKTSAVAATALAGAPTILRAQKKNDTIRMGFIGVGNRGSQLMNMFRQNDDVQIAALCDVYAPFVNRDRGQVHAKMLDSVGDRVPALDEELPPYKKYSDFRKLLDDPDIDAVCIATPDHWHALQTIMACQAGKDVYVEKPLTMTIREGRDMVKVAEANNRIVGVGLNRRGSTVYKHAVDLVQQGNIGQVSLAFAARVSNMFPNGIGMYPAVDPPSDLDWDMWLGPRAYRPFQFNIAPYKFRWWSDYSSQMGNWGVHYIDCIRWMLNKQAPIAVTAQGSRKLIQDDADIPDTMEVVFEFDDGAMLKFSIHEACSGTIVPGGEVELRGTKGNLIVGERSYKISPARPGQFQEWTIPEIAEEKSVGELLGDPEARENTTANLIRNFIDCVKSRNTPWCPLEEGHRSTTFAHLANIALARGKRLKWDAEQERFTNDDKANSMLHYDYRQPWKLEG